MADVAQVLADAPTLAAAPAPVQLPMGVEERKRRARIAEALVMQAADTSPVQSWTQGLARVANGLVGGLEERRLDRDERGQADQLNKLLLANPALGGGGAAAAPATPPARSSSLDVPPTVGAGVAPSDAISSIESGGDYNSLGVVIPKTGDRAYGKYQVMGANIPAWTREHVGREMSPQEFLASPDAQEAVFKGQFGKYVGKYGPEGAARAWFAGEPGMNDLTRKDPLGTSVADYSRKFQTASLGPAGAPGGAPGVPENVATAFQPSTPSLAPAAAPGAPAAAGAPTAVAAAAAPGDGASAAPGSVTGGPTGGAARMQTAMDPQMQAYVRVLLASRNPAAMARAQAILDQYSKPTELKYQTVGSTILGLDPATGALRAKYDVNDPDLQKLDDGRLFDKKTARIINVAPGTRSLTDPTQRAAAGIAPTDNRTIQVDTSGKLTPLTEPQRNDFEHTPDGRILDKHTGQYVAPAAAGFKPLVDPADRARFGIPATDNRPYQVDSAGKLINPPPETRINIDQKAEGAFENEGGKLQAERFNKLVQGGYDAKGMIADLNVLRDIGSRITPGKSAEFKAAIGPYAEMVGVKVDGLSDLQAYNAVVAKLQPRMRVSGSGATSDYEMRQFLASLPSLGKTAGGNAIIANTLEALQQQHIAAAEIGSKALAGEIKRADAEKQLRELPDPFELWKKSHGGKAPSAPVTPPSGFKVVE